MQAVTQISPVSKSSNAWHSYFVMAFALIECITHFGSVQGDSSGYVDMVKLFRGTATPQEALIAGWHGMLRPVIPLLAVPVSFVAGYPTAIAAVNTVFVVIGTLFMYKFGTKLLTPEIGFISAIAFASATPVLTYGAAVLTDGPGYVMLIVLFYLIVFLLPEKNSLEFACLIGLLLAVGILTKETTVILLIFTPLFYLANRARLKLQNVIVILLLGLAIPLGWAQAIGQSYFGYYSVGVAYAGSGYEGPLLHARLFMLSAIVAFAILLPFAFMAFFTLKDKSIFETICLVLLSAGLIVLGWPTLPESRLTFYTFPAVIPLAALGVTQACEVLADRPFFRFLTKKQWLILVLLLIIISTNASRGYLKLASRFVELH